MNIILSVVFLLSFINDHIMLPLLPFVTVLCGGYFLIKIRFYKPSRIKKAVLSLFKRNDSDGISPLAALSVALAGTLGVGNIVGVAVAISSGGAGAVFWMWICAVFSLGLKYSETVLSVRFNRDEKSGRVGGPMYYIYHGARMKKLSYFFCALCIASSLASGCVIQSNSAARAVSVYGIPIYVTGAVLAVLCGVIVIGGIKSISRFTMASIPLMTAVFMFFSLFIIISNISSVPRILKDIISSAFGFDSALSGITGYGVAAAIKHGVAKSSLSHEAGAGTSAISHGASNTKSPAEQGFLGMFEVFADTVIMCTVTAFVILIAYPEMNIADAYDGIGITVDAYAVFLGDTAHHLIAICVTFFAFATLICWSYYGVSCVRYVSKNRIFSNIYLLIYCVCIFIGSCVGVECVWYLTDFFTCALIFLNVPVTLKLQKFVVYETEKYYSQ